MAVVRRRVVYGAVSEHGVQRGVQYLTVDNTRRSQARLQLGRHRRQQGDGPHIVEQSASGNAAISERCGVERSATTQPRHKDD